jgi:hypothetical protein
LLAVYRKRCPVWVDLSAMCCTVGEQAGRHAYIFIIIVSFPFRARYSTFGAHHRIIGGSRSEAIGRQSRRFGFEADVADDIPVSDNGDSAVDGQVDAEAMRLAGLSICCCHGVVELCDGAEQDGAEFGGVGED